MKRTFCFLVLLVALFALLASPIPALAQEENPPAETEEVVMDGEDEKPSAIVADALKAIATIISTLILIALNGATGSFGVELLKDASRSLASLSTKYLKWMQVNGIGSVLILLAATWLLVTGYDQDFVSKFAIFKDLDPELLDLFNIIIACVAGLISHKAFLAKIFKARPAA